MPDKISKRVKKYKLIIVLSICIAIIGFEALLGGGHIAFYQKWNECGQKPVATAGSGYLNAGAVHYFEPPVVSLFAPSIEYFCTPLEAERAGYSASPDTYDFPHLRDSGE